MTSHAATALLSWLSMIVSICSMVYAVSVSNSVGKYVGTNPRTRREPPKPVEGDDD